MVYFQMIPKIVTLQFLLLFLFTLGCTKSELPYQDAKEVMGAVIKAEEELIQLLNGAEKAGEAVSALSGFTKEMRKLGPKLIQVKRKYRNLEKETPEELKNLQSRSKKVALLMSDAFSRADSRFGKDPKFKSAQREYIFTFTQLIMK